MSTAVANSQNSISLRPLSVASVEVRNQKGFDAMRSWTTKEAKLVLEWARATSRRENRTLTKSRSS